MSEAIRRAARIAERRPKTIIALWLAIVAGCLLAGSLTGTRELADSDAAVGETRVAERHLADAGLDSPAAEAFLVRSGDAATTRAAAADLQRRLRADDHVAAATADPAQATPDGKAVLVQATLRGSPDDAGDAAGALERAADAVGRDGVTVRHAGAASFTHEFEEILGKDLVRAEVVSIPITLLILVLAFGAVVAACVPLILGITAVAGAMGALGVVSQITPVQDATTTVVTLIGLAVGIDYSLFYVRRFREERAAGKGRNAALDATAATVGRAVVVSGFTVLVAVAGLLLTGMAVFASMAVGTIVVVALAVLGSVTVLPATLTLLGDKLDKGHIGRRRRAGRATRRPLSGRLAHAVTGRPVLALAVVVTLFGGLASVATDMRTATPDVDDLPQDAQVVVAQRAIESTFGAAPAGAQVVVTGRDLQQRRASLIDLGERAAKAGGGRGAPAVQVAPDGRTARIDIPMGAGDVLAQRAAVGDVRQALENPGVPGARAWLTGQAASSADFTAKLSSRTPIVIAVVLLVAMVLLIATFRSPLLAVGVMALNLLSVGATYGFLTGVFQKGWGESLLGFESSGAIVDWLPLFAFVILFGLSMDYTILVLERVREARAAGRSARAAATEGVTATAGAVTSAALVMVAVFAPYATLSLLEFKQFGLGLAAAILLDATIVRGIALPALITLVGERGWRVPLDRPRRRSAWETGERVRV